MVVAPMLRKFWARNIWQSKVPATHANYRVYKNSSGRYSIFSIIVPTNIISVIVIVRYSCYNIYHDNLQPLTTPLLSGVFSLHFGQLLSISSLIFFWFHCLFLVLYYIMIIYNHSQFHCWVEYFLSVLGNSHTFHPLHFSDFIVLGLHPFNFAQAFFSPKVQCI